MREETLQFETEIGNMRLRLERAGGMPLGDVVVHLHAVKRFLTRCASSEVERDLLVAMERAGLGDVVEALLPLVR